jgi:lipoprotein signal peptidase
VGGVFFWVAVLQGIMLGYLSVSPLFVCNASGAWPFSQLSFLGGSILTLIFTAIVAFWSWKALAQTLLNQWQTFFWAIIVATGLSHSLERLSSQCVLDYWQLGAFGQNIHFNLGDVSLTVGVVFFIGYWVWEHKYKS